MPNYDDYDAVIFDCDGVILDSNNMKISAMERALSATGYPETHISCAISYFKNNFGKNRFHHVNYFVGDLLGAALPESVDAGSLKAEIISAYAEAVEQEYMEVSETDGVRHLLASWFARSDLYIASGSEQEQLQRVMKARNLDGFFIDILGSPTSKVDNVRKIIDKGYKKVLFIGDAVADMQAAFDNGIDFVFYSPYSNVKSEMMELSEKFKFLEISDYQVLYDTTA
jgi:phosphoglycolate phosphatase-like HAD superfamily hydrolase